MKRILVSVGIGIGVTVLIFVVTALATGACHCSTPVKIFFPFATLLEGFVGSDILGSLLFVLQFPAYAVILAMVSLRLGGVWTALGILMLLGIHLVAALMASQVPG